MLNNITIMGRLTKEPELRTTRGGARVAVFTVACERDYAPEGNDKLTDFISCTAWKSTADLIMKYFHKGSMIVVNGRMQSNKWEDKYGQKRVDWDINVDTVYFGESKKRSSPDVSVDENFNEVPDDGDLPF